MEENTPTEGAKRNRSKYQLSEGPGLVRVDSAEPIPELIKTPTGSALRPTSLRGLCYLGYAQDVPLSWQDIPVRARAGTAKQRFRESSYNHYYTIELGDPSPSQIADRETGARPR